MKIKNKTIDVKTKETLDFVDITEFIEKFIKENKMKISKKILKKQLPGLKVTNTIIYLREM